MSTANRWPSTVARSEGFCTSTSKACPSISTTYFILATGPLGATQHGAAAVGLPGVVPDTLGLAGSPGRRRAFLDSYQGGCQGRQGLHPLSPVGLLAPFPMYEAGIEVAGQESGVLHDEAMEGYGGID